MKTLEEKMMRLALSEAAKGWGRTSPNPMVGAVVADGDRVLGKGWHARAGGPHAEIEALRKAGSDARGATIYVTLEPCHHHGRTPPCTRAILEAGIKKVVVGARDPNPVAGGGAEFLTERGLEVRLGVLEERARNLNEVFNKYITTGRPFVVLKTAATLDGKIAASSGDSRWVTGEKARKYVHRLRQGLDAILVGRGTVELDDPSLNTRGRRRGRNPVRVVLDTKLSLPLSARVFDSDAGGPTIVAAGPRPPSRKREALEKRGVRVWNLPLYNKRVSLAALVERLGRDQITGLLIEGGAEVNFAALLDEKIVDKVLFFYAPKVIGGSEAPTLVGGCGLELMNQALNLDILKVRRFGPDLLIEAEPKY